MFRFDRSVVLFTIAVLAACSGQLSGGRPPDRPNSSGGDAGGGSGGDPVGGGASGLSTACELSNVYTGLKPACVTCHDSGSSLPAFASQASFFNLIASNPHFVLPGRSSESELVRLLDARGGSNGTRQMPLGQKTYDQLVRDGTARVSVSTVRCWIDALPPTQQISTKVASGAVLRRVSATQLTKSLQLHLGLTDADFTSVAPDRLPVVSPDSPRRTERSLQAHHGRFVSLGGANWLDNVPPNRDVSPDYFLNLVQVSQAWCKLAVTKANNSALFRFAALTDRTATALPRIEQNIDALYERLLAQPPDPAAHQALLALFRKYEPTSTTVAWQAVCAAVVRHPLYQSL